MTAPLAFRAAYADWKLIRTRQTVQIVFEIPLSDADAAYKVLGGMPNSASENWFAVAPLKSGKEAMPNPEPILSGPDNAQPQPENTAAPTGAKRDWRGMKPSAQAAMRCDQPPFWAFLNEGKHHYAISNKDEAAEAVREICCVKSRSELNDNHKARVLWHQLDEAFLAWKYVDA